MNQKIKVSPEYSKFAIHSFSTDANSGSMEGGGGSWKVEKQPNQTDFRSFEE